MKVLGIESSCDETAAAVVTSGGEVRSSVVASQVDLHAPFGGIVPELASRAHLRAVGGVVARALEEAGVHLGALDGIVATAGPGLVGSLLVGLQYAKALAWGSGLPLLGVDHLEGHLLAADLRWGTANETPPPERPYAALLVSGGHTALYEVRDVGDVELLGQTRDGAAGEAYDKVAHLLGLGYPGGPVVDRLAAEGDPTRFALPRPMLERPGFDFSFAGLKTAVARLVDRLGGREALSERDVRDVCAAFQAAVVEVLVHKTVRAASARDLRTVVLTGGVAANRGLRARAAERCDVAGLRLVVPPLRACTDNAAMIAYVGAVRLARGERSDLDLRAYPRDAARRRGRFGRDGSLRSPVRSASGSG